MKQLTYKDCCVNLLMKLPEDDVNAAFGLLTMNRSERRKFEKAKFKTKIMIALGPELFRKQILEYLNEQINADNDYKNKTFEDLMQEMNEENGYSIVLFLLTNCINQEYRDKYFEKLSSSEKFECVMFDTWNFYNEETDFEENAEIVDDVVEEEQTEEQIDKKEENSVQEHTNVKYLGHIEKINTYYNFKPEFTYEDGMVTPIDEYDRKEQFPEQGKINLSYLRQYGMSESQKFLTNEIYADESVAEDDIPNSAFYVLNVDRYDITENFNDSIRMKIDLQDLYNKNINLKDVIYPIEKENFYKVVTPVENVLTDDMFSGNIFVNEESYRPGIDVLLKYNERLYGPYKLYERTIDGCKYVKPNVGEKNYIVKSYKFSNWNKLIFTKNVRYDTIETEVVKLPENYIEEDKISDSIILNKFKDDIDFDLAKTNPDEFERQCTTSPFLTNIPVEIYDSRMQRIKIIFEDVGTFSDEKKQIIKDLLLNLKDGELKDILGEEIKKTDVYKELLADVENSEKVQIELEKFKNENNALTERVNELENNNTSSEEYNELVEKNNELTKRCEMYENNETLHKNTEKLREENEKLNAINEDLVIKNNDLNDKAFALRKRVSDAIEEGVKDAGVGKAFDPYLSNAMLKAAAMWQKEEEDNKYESAIKKFNDLVEKNGLLDEDSLVDSLVEKIQQYRNYNRNDILNILICLSQNFLTVFSGDPGTGKTSICNIVSHCLGLDNLSDPNDVVSINRYVPVSVERGWSSKRDLIGYYNPLTKQYDRSNSKIYDALMILDREGESSKYPYVVLLDEANLSPMEYYWADFMRATDRDNQDIYINIGLENDLYIPKTLRFLATINNDQTTEQLSPRLLDRTWVVKLPKVELKENVPSIKATNEAIVSWYSLQNYFVKATNKEIVLDKVLNDIYDLFENHNLSISPRIRKSIKDYICVAQNIMENEIGVCTNKQKALDFAIIQKLLPKIDGYWENYKRLFESLKQICVENHLQMTIKALNDMEKFQEQNMGYCKYLV